MITKSRALLLAGIGCLIVGGVLLVFASEAGTLFGTTLGITGVAVIGWAWARRQ